MKASTVTKDLFVKAKDYGKHIVEQLNICKQPYLTVSHLSDRLRKAGFHHIHQTDAEWKIQAGGSYFFTRNGSSLVAFTVGTKCSAESLPDCFKIVGAHSDSPVLKFAPHSKLSAYGFEQIATQLYGGGLWHTWFDRDLAVAGRVVVKTPEGKLQSRLYDSKRAILRIPNMAIHLQTAEERRAFSFNTETQLRPIIATTIVNQLMDKDADPEEGKKEDGDKNKIEKKLLKTFLREIADQCCCEIDDIVDFELGIHDAQPSALIGLFEEFISSPRLDNMLSSLCSIDAILSEAATPSENSNISMICLFDHEEVGSASAQGADSALLPDALERIYYSIAKTAGADMGKLSALYHAMLLKSMFLSVDMAHGIHPNYSHKHQVNHMPYMHEGVVLKWNANQRYMTDSISASIVKEIAKKADVPLQEFIVRNDSSCGSTIGPMIASKLGIKTIDMGVAQLSMHSIREFCGVVDVLKYKDLFECFFTGFESASAGTILDN